MKSKALIFLTFLLTSQGYGWYPEHTLMVTDFPLRSDFLAPTRIPSLSIQALGPYFNFIYRHPLDNAFQNPAYLQQGPRHFLYLDLLGETQEPEIQLNVPGWDYTASSVRDIYPYPWASLPGPKTGELEPLFRVLYLGKPLGKRLSLGLGLVYEFMYNQEKFYQPFWYWWGYRAEDAVGLAYEQGTRDPYQDYRLVESGENLETNRGHRLSTLLSYPILNNVVLGIRYTLNQEDIDGKYRDMDSQDDSYWADDYRSYYDNRRARVQAYDQSDLQVGLLYSTMGGFTLGLSGGQTGGKIDRTYTTMDTSYYFSYYGPPDRRNEYQNQSRMDNTKTWIYDGTGPYGNLHLDLPTSWGLLVRVAVYGENRRADLTEAEELIQRSAYRSGWWEYPEEEEVERESQSISSAEMIRSGSGTYAVRIRRGSLGGDWSPSSKIRVIGGLVYDRYSLQHRVREPFTGSKYSYVYYKNYPWVDYTTREEWQEDEKEFRWERTESRSTIAVPLGVEVSLGDHVRFQAGATKIIQIFDRDEDYDLVVIDEKNTIKFDDTPYVEEDPDHVEGHVLPGIHEFINEFRLNYGVAVHFKDRFYLTAVLNESLLEPRSFEIGMELSW